jgi:leader peptidase (prepilin peptidase)/N-methyltransferase
MPVVTVATALIAGLTAGAAARPLITAYSVPRSEPLRLTCPACSTPITSPSPRNWIRAATGRCHSCHARLGPAPAAPELLAAALFAGLAATGAAGWSGAAQYWIAACGTALTLIDLAVHRLPNALTLPASAGTLLLLAAGELAGAHGSFWRAAAAAATVTAVYLGLALAGMGWGDVKLAPAVGALLGWSSWAAVLGGAFTGFALAATASVILLATGKATRQSRIAFGPYMILGALVLSVLTAP